MSKSRHILLGILFFVAALSLSGCKFALLDPKGIIAADEKNIMITSVWLMSIVIVPVIILTFVFAWRYRAGNTKAKYTPDWSHSTVLELIWWSVPCIIIAILATITWKSTHELDPYKPLAVNNSKPITIQAIALEWKWLFIYPEQNIATINFVQFPAGVPVTFLITAEGPMNSFQIPQLAGQIYAMAGMQTKLNLIANAEGDYAGISANFSGDGFAGMKFTARASSQAQFDQWVKSVKQSPDKLTMAAYHRLVQPSENNRIQQFSAANSKIFEMAIMKSMMPMSMKDMASAE
ncbi:ubiquinol oxidase subunit II [Aquicella lusitana]|uniref:Ubiquinol oxidase subunit 2 n=1 Tax=Aquicella lusitana TaxID=254246 RepID=A0A370GIC0_9COXI|nr:ubiquinol oxidase subunit II [Aquicella lusitana]RDI43401.1 cytochrome bo3 quinol oxidase subunit 2 [Aquicella lusitana]VVC73551.1 Cytochrome bo(3) ubiquinol oxidase subunit 2 [Aquicella lusitana]